ncbi:nucleotidyltransferase domain-containing protein [Chondromyces crocatus]|uniref:Polymerase nucleotidyl transferase domain-containing protein n=1 Tax=Chondromyces crocatus TaxID=52 RepID=A0A0K1EMF5_CHOCO|nr:nucleotidyltransferase domain-containing protein [Chondromyces crocatus]AKT42070.1 uncharacterized protein CMC5_062930 [Chondromyces crocatus]
MPPTPPSSSAPASSPRPSATAPLPVAPSDRVSPHERRVIEALAEQHGCHAAILYGSRGRGEGRPDSDHDLLLVRKDGAAERLVRPIEGLAIDAWIEPEAALDVTKDPGLLRIREGIVIVDAHGFGAALLKRAQQVFREGPAPLPPGEREALQAWGQKMLARLAERSIEGNYRRASLLAELLPAYFQLRGAFYLGPREALQQLAKEDVCVYEAFSGALEPGAPDSAIARLVNLVIDQAPGG